jgi:magnesium-transporting ATPase (P-type)
VRVSAGDKVPGDLRLLQARNLRAEESALTGESVPADKSVEAVEAGSTVGDRSSMLFSGSTVAGGQGVGVVTATGPRAEIGRIEGMLSGVEELETPLNRQVDAFGKSLSVVILVMAVVMVLIGWLLHGFGRDELISATIGFAVAAVPEGLPAVVTITLALGVQQMAKRRAITRKLTAVETLGAVTTICSDKTGTLTKNEMTAREIVTSTSGYAVTGLGYAPEGDIEQDGSPVSLEDRADLRELVTALAVCNDADVARREDRWLLVGEPTEGALRTLGLKAALDHREYQRLDVVPFNSEQKVMGTLNLSPDGRSVVLVKGAPDRLLQRSSRQSSADGGLEPLDVRFWEGAIERLGNEGLRVLAAASKPADDRTQNLEPDDIAEGLCFLGLVGILDPPRPEAIDAIATCHRAGITVKMITGDHAGTAAAIAREMRITGEDSPSAVTGAEIERASDEQLLEIVRGSDTFARTSPEHKLRLVQALQANGHVVAMTGDGVNDAPALKRADVGVAMGIKGTEVTKEAAEIVLTDDNFASIEHAVEEGRRIYDNLQKSILFILPTNGAQSLVILVAVLFGFALPLEPVQILWVNMVVAVTLSLALVFEPAEPDLMTRRPRRKDASLLEKRFLGRIAVASVGIAGATLLTFRIAQGLQLPHEVAQSWAVTALVLAQAAYLINARFIRKSSLRAEALRGNATVWRVIAVLVVLHLALVYLPFMHTWFGTAPIDIRGWGLALVLAVGVFLLVELGKAALRTYESRLASSTANQETRS